MEAYRHVNVLVGERIYDALREASFRQKKSISEITREGIRIVLTGGCKNCKGRGEVVANEKI